MDKPKKKSSWEGITPEQRAARIEKANATRKATLEEHKKWLARVSSEKAKEKYEAFLKDPHWAMYLRPEYIDDVLVILGEVDEMYQALAKAKHSDFDRYDKLCLEMKKSATYDITGTEEYISLRSKLIRAIKGSTGAMAKLLRLASLRRSLERYKCGLVEPIDPVAELCKFSRDN